MDLFKKLKNVTEDSIIVYKIPAAYDFLLFLSFYHKVIKAQWKHSPTVQQKIV